MNAASLFVFLQASLLAVASPAVLRPEEPTPFTAQATTPQQAPVLDEVVDRLQGTYNAMNDYSAEFTQVHQNLAAGTSDTLTGTVYFFRPGRMRWDYITPAPKYLITDGQTFWSIDPANAQYFEGPLADAQLPTALRFLMGEGQLRDDFEIAFDGEPSATAAALRLVPRVPTGDYEHLIFRVDLQTNQLTDVRIVDALGNVNAFAFTAPQVDAGGMEPFMFTYAPAPGMTRLEAPAP